MIFGHFGRPGAHFGSPWAILDARGSILMKKAPKFRETLPPFGGHFFMFFQLLGD